MRLAHALSLALIASFLTGCAELAVNTEVDSVKQWAIPAQERARAGAIKWSDYYQGLYSRIAEQPEMADKAFLLRASNTMIDAALAMESGNMTQQQFESAQRSVFAMVTERDDQARADVDAANGAAWARAVQAWRDSRPVRCVSTRAWNTVSTTCR